MKMKANPFIGYAEKVRVADDVYCVRIATLEVSPSKANSRAMSSLRPHRHPGGATCYPAAVLESHEDSVRSRIKGDIAIALEIPKVGVGLCYRLTPSC